MSDGAVPVAATKGTAVGGTGATATGKGAPGARITGTGRGTAGGTMLIPGGTPGNPLFTPPGKPKKRFIAGLAFMRALIGRPCKLKQR